MIEAQTRAILDATTVLPDKARFFSGEPFAREAMRDLVELAGEARARDLLMAHGTMLIKPESIALRVVDRIEERIRAAGFTPVLAHPLRLDCKDIRLLLSTRIRNVPLFPAIEMSPAGSEPLGSCDGCSHANSHHTTLRERQYFPVSGLLGRFHDNPVDPGVDGLLILRRVRDRVGSISGELEYPVLIMDRHAASLEGTQPH